MRRSIKEARSRRRSAPMITETHPTTKAAVAKALAELGVELSASRVKKTRSQT
jgi:hypothetical protein